MSESDFLDRTSRRRSQNFTSAENQAIVDRVELMRSLLFAKQTDSNTNRRKMIAWGQIASACNEVNPYGSRTAEKAKDRWCNMVTIVKKKLADRHRLPPGVPIPHHSQLNDLEIRIADLLRMSPPLYAPEPGDSEPELGQIANDQLNVLITECKSEGSSVSEAPSPSVPLCQPAITTGEPLAFQPHLNTESYESSSKRPRMELSPGPTETLEELQMQLIREKLAKVRAERQLAIAAKQREDLHRVKLQWEVEKLKAEKYKIDLEIRNLTANTDFTDDNSYN